jgi:hypothetical protein
MPPTFVPPRDDPEFSAPAKEARKALPSLPDGSPSLMTTRTLMLAVLWAALYLGLLKPLGWYAVESQHWQPGWGREWYCLASSVLTLFAMLLWCLPVGWLVAATGHDCLTFEDGCLPTLVILVATGATIALGVWLCR